MQLEGMEEVAEEIIRLASIDSDGTMPVMRIINSRLVRGLSSCCNE